MKKEAMNKDDENLIALKLVLSRTDERDWYLIHNTVRKYVAEGKLSEEGEKKYKDMVDEMIQQNKKEKIGEERPPRDFGEKR